MWNYVLILHILHSACRRLRPDYHRNSWNFIRKKWYAFCRRHSKLKKMLAIRSHRGPTSLHVQQYYSIIVMLCGFLSRWKHVDDQSEQRVGVVVSVLRLAIVPIRPSQRAVAVPPVSGYLPVLWRARVVMSTCCTETNAHAHRAFRCNGFFCSYEYNNVRVAIFTIVLLVT